MDEKRGEYPVPEFGQAGLVPRYNQDLFKPLDHPIQRFANVKPTSPTQTPPPLAPA
jgi:hypothetical protein